MATETPSSESTEGTPEEISEGQEKEGQQNQSTGETPGQDGQQPKGEGDKPDDSIPDEKSAAEEAERKRKSLLADLNKERKDLKAAKERVTELENQVKDLQPKAETTEAIQARFDRLEGFLQAIGGPLSKALDSKSFTHELFETDKDIATIVKDWNRANPSVTSTALGSAAGESKPKVDPNTLLRAAAGK